MKHLKLSRMTRRQLLRSTTAGAVLAPFVPALLDREATAHAQAGNKKMLMVELAASDLFRFTRTP